MIRSRTMTPEALQDIDLSRQSLELGHRFIDALEKTVDHARRMPGIGTLIDTIQPDIIGTRFGIMGGFPAYLIFYRSDEEEVIILRVIHGSRDFTRQI